jgi:hypothetical protein
MARTVRIVSRLQLMPARVERLVPLPSEVARPEPPDIVLCTGCPVRGTPPILVSVSEVLRALDIETEIVGAAMGLRIDDTDTRLKIGPEADLVMPKCAALIAQHRLDPDEARRLLFADQAALKPVQCDVLEHSAPIRRRSCRRLFS